MRRAQRKGLLHTAQVVVAEEQQGAKLYDRIVTKNIFLPNSHRSALCP